ncbi:MAG: MFS transporter [Fimbriimonadales bacterium]
MNSDRLTKTQWQGFGAAWLGWTFDGLDGFLYSLVALKFVQELMAGAPESEAKQRAALIQAVFLFGWAIGGAVFGRVGDRIGRTRTLTLTILTYALFTGASCLAQTWWQLMIFRFVTALGIGGEWAAGSALVSEMFAPRHRTWASPTLQSGFQVGMIAAALTTGWMSGITAEHGQRYVFIVGLIPALFTLWIRKSVPEPEEWHSARSRQEMPKISELFRKGIRHITFVTLALASTALTTIWVFFFFIPEVLKKHPEAAALSDQGKTQLVMSVTVIYALWNIAGNYFSGLVARWVGYRRYFILIFSISVFCLLYGFSGPRPLAEQILWIYVTVFFAGSVFAVFPLYIPPLFPTLLRTTGAGFSYNFGRIIAAVGTLCGAAIWGKAEARDVIHYVGFIPIVGVVAALFAPELRPDQASLHTESLPFLLPGGSYQEEEGVGG